MTDAELSGTLGSYRSMLDRCLNPLCHAYKDYGGRGITIDDAWLYWPNFLEDMGARPAGASLDRIDNSKGYQPSNCRWTDRKTQARNTRRNVRIGGEYQCDIAVRLGVHDGTLTRRRQAGRPVDERHGHKLSEPQVHAIRAASDKHASYLAGLYSVSRQTIDSIRARRSWKNV